VKDEPIESAARRTSSMKACTTFTNTTIPDAASSTSLVLGLNFVEFRQIHVIYNKFA
jgi:hypothetical protein